MKRFHGVIRWAGILFAPLLLYAIAPNLAINVLNRLCARVFLTSAQLREASDWLSPPQKEAPTIFSTPLRKVNAEKNGDTPTIANGQNTATQDLLSHR